MNLLQRLWFRTTTGSDIVNLGRADEVVIRYKDKYISILESPDDGEIKSLGWTENIGHLHVPIREFWKAEPPKKKEKLPPPLNPLALKGRDDK